MSKHALKGKRENDNHVAYSCYYIQSSLENFSRENRKLRYYMNNSEPLTKKFWDELFTFQDQAGARKMNSFTNNRSLSVLALNNY